MKHCMRVMVDQGIFSCERSASFTVNGVHYNLLADASFFEGDLMAVRVMAVEGDRCLIDLPNETFTTGNRIFVPMAMILNRPAAVQNDETLTGEIAKLAITGGAFDWLAHEPELYNDTRGESV